MDNGYRIYYYYLAPAAELWNYLSDLLDYYERVFHGEGLYERKILGKSTGV